MRGIHPLSLDQRKFDPSPDDIKRICRFFSLGELRHYEKEKNTVIPHTNFFVFIATDRGQYALKFYPSNAAKTIAVEYALNRVLAAYHFPTAVMYSGQAAQAFFPSNDRLAVCLSYIDGRPAWQCIKQRNIFPKINAAMLSLKNILSTAKGRIPYLKQENFTTTVKTLAQTSRAMAPYDQKRTIDASLQDACRTYQHHQQLFTRQWVHNNATLTNFLIYKGTVYSLDLCHVKEDYALSDLASLVISCLVFDIPTKKIKTITQNYFSQHRIGPEHFPALNTLIKIQLIKKYLKNVQHEKSVDFSTYPSGLVQTHIYRQGSIAEILKTRSRLDGVHV